MSWRIPWLADLEAWLLEKSLGGFTAERARLLEPVRGRVLEIGFGTGLNLPHYGPGVEHLDVVEPAAHLSKRAAARIAATELELALHRASAEAMPFADGQFDYAVSTFALCSIPDPARALREVRRVLRPGGIFVFLEHGLHRDAGIARWQARLNRLHRCIASGCNLDRPIDRLVADSGLHIDALDRTDWPDAWWIYGEVYRGTTAA